MANIVVTRSSTSVKADGFPAYRLSVPRRRSSTHSGTQSMLPTPSWSSMPTSSAAPGARPSTLWNNCDRLLPASCECANVVRTAPRSLPVARAPA